MTTFAIPEAPEVLPSLDRFQQAVIEQAEPLSQNTSHDNMGFGWIYYSLARNQRPEVAIAIGSRRGFMPFCLARALKDNGRGHVFFIDPSYSGGDHPGWGGGALWSDPTEVSRRIAGFGLTGWITHLKMTSEEAFPQIKGQLDGRAVGLVVIDGAHTYENCLQDFDLYSSLMTEGFCVFHDAVSTNCDVPRVLHTLRNRGHDLVTIHREVGLAVLEIWHPPAVEETWKYLTGRSNRGQLIAAAARELLRPGDRLLDVYCGYSPLASVLDEVSFFGCDRDPQIVARLRREFPRHHWECIDETRLPFAALPEESDVLVGLGVSRGHAWWDPQHVLDNIRYLLGRYHPRACIFETAADYYHADILTDLIGALERLGYAWREQVVETDMASFARRKLLFATRSL
jgi:hypothetical protein